MVNRHEVVGVAVVGVAAVVVVAAAAAVVVVAVVAVAVVAAVVGMAAVVDKVQLPVLTLGLELGLVAAISGNQIELTGRAAPERSSSRSCR